MYARSANLSRDHRPRKAVGAALGEVAIDLLQDFIKGRAMLMFDDPLLKAFEGRMIGTSREQRIVDEPLDQHMEADLKFELA